MMLCGSFVCEDGAAKAALISDNKIIGHVAHTMPWEIGHHLMMNKAGTALGNILTLYPLRNNATRKNSLGYIIRGSLDEGMR